SALAYGTVHYWALGVFNLGALTILVLWVVDGFSLGTFRVNRNALQLPLLGGLVLGQLSALLIYFAATLVFIDTRHRLEVLVRTIMVFGVLLAILGLTQSI